MKTLAMLAVLALALPSCTIAKIQGSGSKPLVLNQLHASAQTRPFEASEFQAFDWTHSVNIDDVLRENATGIDDPNVSGAQNVRVEVKIEPLNYLLNLVTLGWAQSQTIVVKGDLVLDRSAE